MSQFLTDLVYTTTTVISKGNPVFKLTAPYKYQSDYLKSQNHLYDLFGVDGIVIVPMNFVTDFATIPWPLNLIISPLGPWKNASVIHDYLCRQAAAQTEITRADADTVFKEALIVSGISKPTVYLFWGYVKMYGYLNAKWLS